MKALSCGFAVAALLLGATFPGKRGLAVPAGQGPNEILKPFVYRASQLPDASRAEPDLPAPAGPRERSDLAEAARSPAVAMTPYNVQSRQDRSFRDVNTAIAHENLLAPCYIVTKDLHGGRQLRTMGAPVGPLFAESQGGRLQARFQSFLWVGRGMTLLRAAALSDIGKMRVENEDRFLIDEELQVYGVADGVGGLPGGGEAAEAARTTVLAAFRELPAGAHPDLMGIVVQANDAVAEAGRKVSPRCGSATTLTFGCARAGMLRIAHIGDSRCYLMSRLGRLTQLTEDHNVENEARRLRFQGRLTDYSPIDGRAITRCLGTPSPNADVVSHPLAAGDRYLFCTDGITGLLTDAEIGEILRRPMEPAALLSELIGCALDRGGNDNATAVLVFVDEA